MQSAAEQLHCVDNCRDSLSLIHLFILVEDTELLAFGLDTQAVTALSSEKIMLVIYVHLRVVENDLIINPAEQRIDAAYRPFKIGLGVAVGKQDILHSLPVDVV